MNERMVEKRNWCTNVISKKMNKKHKVSSMCYFSTAKFNRNIFKVKALRNWVKVIGALFYLMPYMLRRRKHSNVNLVLTGICAVRLTARNDY